MMKFMSSGKRPFLIQRLTQHACIERVTGLGKSNRKSELSECTFFSQNISKIVYFPSVSRMLH